MADVPINPANANEVWLLRQLHFVADGIIRGRRTTGRHEVKLQKWYTGVSVVFSLLATAGLVKTKVDALPADQMSLTFVGAIASLVVLIVLELYRAYGVEQTASKLRSAKDAYSGLEVDTRHALQKDNPLPEMEKVLIQANSIAKTFHLVLLPAPKHEVDALVAEWVTTFRPADGWGLVVSQQKKKRGAS